MYLKIFLKDDQIHTSVEGSVGELSELLLSLTDLKGNRGEAIILLTAAAVFEKLGKNELCAMCAETIEELFEQKNEEE